MVRGRSASRLPSARRQALIDIPLKKPDVSQVTQGSIWLALVAVYLVWGSTYLAIRVAVATMPPLLMAGTRFLIAGAVLYLWRMAVAPRSGARPTAAHWRSAAIVGALLMLGGNGGVALGELTVPSGITALVAATVPLWIALLDRMFFGRQLPPKAIVGLLIGFGGVVALIVCVGGLGTPTAGSLILCAACLSWAAGSLYVRDAELPSDSLLAVGMEMVVGGAMLCLVAALTGEFAGFAHLAVSPQAWWAFAYLIVFGGILGFSAYLWLLRVAPITMVSTYAYVNPVVAMILGIVILHEALNAWIAIAGIVIVASVALIVATPAAQRVPEGADASRLKRT
jgi:drug/metabolite transporter (DMT)-like permease